MDAFQPDLGAALTGLISGILLSIPVGPVNLTIMNEGARRGLLVALIISAGAVMMPKSTPLKTYFAGAFSWS